MATMRSYNSFIQECQIGDLSLSSADVCGLSIEEELYLPY